MNHALFYTSVCQDRGRKHARLKNTAKEITTRFTPLPPSDLKDKEITLIGMLTSNSQIEDIFAYPHETRR
jgi:hypothetical protein